MVRGRLQFTDKEREDLEANKYVKRVSLVNVSFTDEFRDYFVKRYYDGVKVPQIFAECGFDINVLGRARMHGFRARTIGSVSGYKRNKLEELQLQIDELRLQVDELKLRVEGLERYNTLECL